ncbi:uncharacterized protein STEHIDRAFT_149430 [Stereum hirsutum FP-91666 SS1]|uniref:uncharacterized protein n=1 Tax=Stereum hirsutum (strain FP-91666) TaxID=721885 RepID=UPI00044498A5|nr:uncharacterized protein STEHIDRAFT_149430 [Stereum hirsutum FP-91666 SS1]EIM82268.1 hypothetical protein STEHIDRAFT_149430 [Stereum hirsutum FP-91666 SS1]
MSSGICVAGWLPLSALVRTENYGAIRWKATYIWPRSAVYCVLFFSMFAKPVRFIPQIKIS